MRYRPFAQLARATAIALAALMQVVSPAHAGTVDGGAITAEEAKRKINLAGRQRMLSQRIAMALCLAEAGVKPAEMRDLALTSAEVFDQTLKELRAGGSGTNLPAETDPRVLELLAEVETLWAEYNDAIRAQANGAGPGGLARIRDVNPPLLAAMNAAVGAMDEAYGKGLLHPDLARVINVAGRQRMLIQKTMKETCLAVTGPEPAADAEAAAATAQLFTLTLAGLRNGDPADDIMSPPNWEVEAQLELVDSLWTDMMDEHDRALEADKGALDRLHTFSEQALKEMNNAVHLYENI